ncbi:zinc metalloproteinase [Diplodia corticola]|uniref:Zinc metalloproteinase n=1 Tax=Diplodia corticola TaxID=236234 RepID=A0A1J9QKK8_9PEZI|nr:zinc metalloproteinase [Diplodia corticola]OJD29016.1 zinc metalloproteinase [Diplodia corticola]
MASSAEPQAQPHDTSISTDDIATVSTNTTMEADADVTTSSNAPAAGNDTTSSSPPPSASAPPAAAPSDSDSADADAIDDSNTLNITFTHHGTPHTLSLPPTATITTLSAAIATALSIPPTHQKFLITPKPGLLKPPFRDPSLPLAPLVRASRKILLMGSTPAEVSSLQQTVSHAAAQHAARTSRRYAVAAPAAPRRTVAGIAGHSSADATYTFHALRPLPHLPHPERSLALLERLRDDAGVRAAMRRHRFSVGLLTEMDPAMHTTREGRTLGLNRNRGEVVELRLRTDAGDGYREYGGVRRTLCHELAHCVWGEHDGRFWALCREIEGEVERGDWWGGGKGGRRVGGVGGDEVYVPPPVEDDPEMRGEACDHGGWTGGEYVLGGGGGAGAPVVGSSGEVRVEGAGEGLSRREVLARAAEERAKRARQEEEGGGGGEGK